jgi:hypothetical protein
MNPSVARGWTQSAGSCLRRGRCLGTVSAAWRVLRNCSAPRRVHHNTRRRPTPDISRPLVPVAHEKYEQLVKRARANPAIKVAVVHPCDDVSLQSAVEAQRLDLIDPILVGPELDFGHFCLEGAAVR